MSVASTPRNEQDARLELTQGITILERLGIIDFNGHFSVRLADGNILINTGNSVRSTITPDAFVVVAPDGTFDDTAPNPPKELALHVAVYAARPDVNAVVHGHPKWSTLLSSAGVDYRVTSESVRAYKPHPEPFEAALELLGVDRSRLLHVGDSLGSDVRGARCAPARRAERSPCCAVSGQPTAVAAR